MTTTTTAGMRKTCGTMFVPDPAPLQNLHQKNILVQPKQCNPNIPNPQPCTSGCNPKIPQKSPCSQRPMLPMLRLVPLPSALKMFALGLLLIAPERKWYLENAAIASWPSPCFAALSKRSLFSVSFVFFQALMFPKACV